MKRLLPLLAVSAALLLSACVDKTGLSETTSRTPSGNPNGAVVVTEYGDIQCPACRTSFTALNQPLLAKYGTQIRFEFKHFPLRNIHRYALDLAEASECAADQNKFWEYLDLAYTKQDQLKNSSVRDWAKELGIDNDLFDRCTRSHIKRKTILADYDEGIKLGVQGTPTYFVNGRQTEATLDALSTAVEAGINGAAQRL